MRTHTTYTDLKRICKLHGDGNSVEEIMKIVHIHPNTISEIIAVKFPAQPEPESEPAPTKKKAAKKKVDPIS